MKIYAITCTTQDETNTNIVTQGEVRQQYLDFAAGEDPDVISESMESDDPTEWFLEGDDINLVVAEIEQEQLDRINNKVEAVEGIEEYIANGGEDVQVIGTDDRCVHTQDFSGTVTGKVKKDTDGSKYVTVVDMDGDCFDVPLEFVEMPEEYLGW